MRDWLGAGDSRSRDDSVLGGCSARWTIYSLYAVLGVNSASWHAEIERDDLTLFSQVIVELMMGKRDQMRWEIIMRNWDVRVFRVLVNVLFPIRQE